jgi:hypothetical protein
MVYRTIDGRFGVAHWPGPATLVATLEAALRLISDEVDAADG